MMRILRAVLVAVILGVWAVPSFAAGEYPLTFTVDAQAKTKMTTVSTTFTIRVERLMDESRFKQVTDTLKYNGYSKFFNVFRTLPVIGTIELENRQVELKYAREQQEDGGRRLVLAADRPLFFFGGAPDKNRAGYEMTIVELRFDAHGGATGTMAGAARVKPSPAGIVLDSYAETVIQLTARASRP
jgi:hypothetical protein